VSTSQPSEAILLQSSNVSRQDATKHWPSGLQADVAFGSAQGWHVALSQP
jgi:hypothetical protein